MPRDFALCGIALLVGATACSDQAPSAVDNPVPITITANAVGTPISTLVVEVTALDFPTPLVFNLSVENGVASGTIRIPPGTERTIAITAFDDEGNITHDGNVTIDVRPGQNPPIDVTLRPRGGQVPITVTFAEYSVVVSPAQTEINRSIETNLQLDVTVADANGDQVVEPEVGWATSNPSVAVVSDGGLVTGLTDGSVTIVATYEGVAGLSLITVTSGGSTGPEICNGVDDNQDGQIDEGMLYCINGALAPNTDGSACLGGFADVNGDPADGCEPCGVAEEFVALLNAERASAGVPVLLIDVRLVAAARVHSDDMAATGTLSDAGSDGSTFAERILDAGYPSPSGELVGFGFATAQAAFDAFHEDAASYEIMVNQAHRHIGVAISVAPDGSSWWTVDFGSSGAAPQSPTGCGG